MPTIVIFDKQTGNKHEMEVKGTHTIDSVKAVLARELGYSQGEINLYLDKAPLDAWGRRYLYKYPGDHGLDYDLYSLGRNDKEDETDITNWE